MAQLHELLAVEQGLAETANRITKEVTKTLSTKQTLFAGMSKKHIIFAEENQHMVQATENKEIQSTVEEQLSFLNTHLVGYWDVTLQKEEANQRANADIIINNVTIATAVPAIVLLGMEKKLTSLLAVYNGIPTLDASTAWQIDPAYAKQGVFRATSPIERQQSVTKRDFKEISPATQYHKAQVAEIETTDIIGKYVITDFSGAISSFDKAEKLAKLTTMIRAVKQARQRANNTDVNTTITIGAAILNYINE